MSLENRIVDYDENKEDILHWVKLKGEYRYHEIINFLHENNIRSTWENVTYYIKYDKRLLINLFKYFTFLEEMYKSFIMEYLPVKTRDLNTYLFSKTLNTYLSLEEKANYDGIDLSLLKTAKDRIIQLRNCVAHNKVLLGGIYHKKTLSETLEEFIYILPMPYRKGFIKDINSCSLEITDKSWHISLQVMDNDILV